MRYEGLYQAIEAEERALAAWVDAFPEDIAGDVRTKVPLVELVLDKVADSTVALRALLLRLDVESMVEAGYVDEGLAGCDLMERDLLKLAAEWRDSIELWHRIYGQGAPLHHD